MKSRFKKFLGKDSDGNICVRNFEEFFILQLPGFTDCNDRPLYEGSIVQSVRDDTLGIICYSCEEAFFYIKWKHGGISSFGQDLNCRNLKVRGHVLIKYDLLISKDDMLLTAQILGLTSLEDLYRQLDKTAKLNLQITDD